MWKSGLEFEEIRATTSFSGSSWEAWKKNGSRQRLGELSDVLAASFRFAGNFCCIRSSLKPFVFHFLQQALGLQENFVALDLP